jgi:hypothetical protein
MKAFEKKIKRAKARDERVFAATARARTLLPRITRLMCCAVLCCAVLCCAVLCCAVLCCAVPRSGTAKSPPPQPLPRQCRQRTANPKAHTAFVASAGWRRRHAHGWYVLWPRLVVCRAAFGVDTTRRATSGAVWFAAGWPQLTLKRLQENKPRYTLDHLVKERCAPTDPEHAESP